jgi:radical SAM superfamily enzyme YgiQ (UPF0313 family)
MPAPVLLVNANRIRPPIAPIAIDYLGTALEDAGFEVRVLDLAWSRDLEGDIARALAEPPLFVGLTFRNLDDSSAASRRSFVAEHREVVRLIRARTDAPVVVGGAGLSIAPGAAVRALGAHAAVRGEGEGAIVALARKRPSGGPPIDLSSMLAPRRAFVDNARYFREGAQVGFETLRGCDAKCAYCADPLSKGCRVRVRSPRSVADELEGLLRSGMDVFHTCDGEFNADPDHALSVCEEITARGLGEKIRWYAYCRPDRFSGGLASAMRAAGGVGVNFGADHVDAGMLVRLGRAHRAADIEAARAACRRAGMAVMIDMLFGAPGETRKTIEGAVELLRALDPEAAGIALGLRLYRGTLLGDNLAPPGGPPRPGVTGATDDLLEPAFFTEPGLGGDIDAHLASLVAGDKRFFYLGPAAGGKIANYNYNGNDPLDRAIAAGARGAYWDILRSMR